MKQLRLFKNARRCDDDDGFPVPKESKLQTDLVAFIRQWIMPDWKFTHIASGEKRDILTAVKLKRMGVEKGWPDLIFVSRSGRGVLFMELKRQGGGLSNEQLHVMQHVMQGGCHYHCTDNFDDALGTLKDFGIVRARVSA